MQTQKHGLDALDISSKRVLVRVDFNVPQDAAGAITDDTRIRAALPTIQEILKRGGRPILMSHLGRPKGVDPKLSLEPIAARLSLLLGAPVTRLAASTGAQVEAACAGASGPIVMLENVRFNAGETKGDGALAASYAKLGDVFVNDAFGTSHRDESSVSGVARLLPSAAGRLLEAEIKAFQRVLEKPERPLVAILGGAKISDKLAVIDNLLDRVDCLLIGGGMAYTFLKAQGEKIGTSLCDDTHLDTVREALDKARKRKVEICLPSDHVIAEKFAADAPSKTVVGFIPDGWMALDIGPQTRSLFANRIRSAKTLVWNGPMGVFEMPAFRAGTEAVGRAVAECPGYTVVGGGDSVAAVELLGIADRIRHISTGGGASLELLEGKLLPGIAALKYPV
ncbi:MAG TPA: phosphoglycerate kinase [Planctomycetota bacterium]|nr:phosphoglycerate kinase [Planctomycetota bacterium]